MIKKQLTLVLIHRHPQILLGMKKRGHGEGRWNGFGGKVGTDESILEAAHRELQEESGITAKNLVKVGELDFEYQKEGEVFVTHIFKSENYEGEPIETEEMRPQWFHLDEIPFNEMWPDDIHWFPLVLTGKTFRGRFLFADNNTILEKELLEIDEFLDHQ